MQTSTRSGALGDPQPRSRALFTLALASLVFHFATAHGYGYFRDELYYLACGRHLAAGYVDHPPLVALMATLVERSLGTSLLALRSLPALAVAASVWLAGACAAELGGKPLAQVTAGAAVMFAPVSMAFASYFSMNALELGLWALAFWLCLRLLRSAQPSAGAWSVLGAVLGVALENKVSTLYLGLGLAVGLAASRRALLATRGPWFAALVALALFAPHVAWQIAHDFPTLEFIENARAQKMVALSVPAWLAEQLLLQNPLATPLWLLGLITLLRSPSERPLGIAFLTIVAVLLLGKGKPYYAAAAYLPLFAAGACAVAARPRLQVVSLLLVCIGGLLTMPMAKPILPVPLFVRYQAALSLSGRGAAERHTLGVLPQFFADMHGWPELAREVAEVHAALAPSERARACVFAQNYGQAGAIDQFGPAYGLPSALAGHNSYWLWGPGNCTGETMIVIGSSEGELRAYFDQVELGGTHQCALCMPYETPKPIFVARRLRVPLETLWPSLKHYQ